MKKSLLILMVSMFYLCTSAIAQTYIINTSWEDGKVVPTNAGGETTTSYGQQISTDYARSGSRSCRFEVRASDPKIGGGVRSEQKTDFIFDQTQGDVAWVGYSIYYPNSMVNTPQEEMIGQFMQTDYNNNYSPAVGFKNDGDFMIRAYVRAGNVNTIKNLTAFSFPKGQWVDFVWSVKFSLTGNGYIKCWCNGVQKLDYTGSVGYPGGKANFKWGLYPGWKTGPNGQSPRIVYWDEMKVMRNNGSYALVSPGATTMQDQTITFPSIPTKLTTDADFNPGATASSGLTVSYTSSNTSVATIVSGNIHIVGAGTSTITASQAGNSTYNAATNVTQVLTVNKLSQTITFGTLPSKLTTDADFNPEATASSGLTVSYASSNTAVATIVSGNIHIVGAGTSTITASQAGNTTYNLATNVTQTLTVIVSSSGTFTLNPIHDAYVQDNNTQDGTGINMITKNGSTGYDREAYLMFDMASTGITTATSATLRLYCNLDAGGNSELYKISNDTWTETGITWANKPTSGSLIGSLAGNVGYMEWNVTSYINEELAGNDKASFRVLATNDAYIYFNSKEASSNKPQLVVIGVGGTTKQDQTITFGALPTKLVTDADFNPGATASSGLTVSYISSNTAVATIVSGNIHIVGAGTSTITASQAGNSTYNPASNVTQTLTVTVSSSGTFTLNPIHDAYVQGNNTQDGTGINLMTKNGGITTYDREAYLMFDMASTGITTATSAKLRLYCNLDAGGNSELYKISNDTWTETGITWANKPTSGSLISSQAANVGYMEWDVTSYINEELAGNDKASFRVLATNDAYIYFNSKEASSNKPQLVVIGVGLKSSSMGDIDNLSSASSTDAMKVYPNPLTKDELNIELMNEERALITVTNFVGQVVLSRSVQNVTLVTLSKEDFNKKGIYIISVYQSGKRYSTKLIVQ